MNGLYVRINKQWTRNSGWAQPSWLYYVDVANSQGDVFPGNLHGGMGKYGLTEGEAERLAAHIAVFLDLPIRRFEEQRTTTSTMKEIPSGATS